MKPATLSPVANIVAKVYCPICTHTVPGEVHTVAKRVKVVPGQKCARCSSALDAGIVMHIPQAA